MSFGFGLPHFDPFPENTKGFVTNSDLAAYLIGFFAQHINMAYSFSEKSRLTAGEKQFVDQNNKIVHRLKDLSLGLTEVIFDVGNLHEIEPTFEKNGNILLEFNSDTTSAFDLDKVDAKLSWE
jgi:hypothetical protein